MDSLCSGDSVRIHQTSSDYDGSRSGSGSHTGAAAALTRSLAQPTEPPTWQQDIDTDSLIHRSLPYVTVLMCFNSSAWISCDHTCFISHYLLFILANTVRVSLLQSYWASCALTNERLLRCIALFACLGCNKATDGRTSERFPPLCLPAVVVNADLGEVLSLQDAWPTPRRPLLWMGRSLSRMVMSQGEERGEASCCSARQRFHIVFECPGSRSDEITGDSGRAGKEEKLPTQ